MWVAGLYGYSVFLALFLAGTVLLKWWGDAVFSSFNFLQFVVASLGGWICAVGILRYIFCSILYRFLAVSFIQIVDC